MALPFIQALRRRLDPKPAPNAEPFINIHEDDWGMRNLHPLSAWDHVEADMAESVAASEANFDGVGWTEIRAIKEPERTFGDDGLTVATVAAALAPLMPRVRQFNAGLPSSFDPGKRDPGASYDTDAWCFGFDRDCFVKIEPRTRPGGDDLVGAIWFEAATGDRTRLAVLRQAMEAIDALAPSCIADYWTDAVGRVANSHFMDRYFDFLARNDEPV